MFLVGIGMLGCRTRENTAYETARDAALIAAERCADAAVVDECRERICRDRCASFADSAHLAEACITKCSKRGTCDSDLDCDTGGSCVMIAPRLRRCQPRGDAAIAR